MEIEDKYLKLLGKHVYNKQLDKFGYISCLEILSGIRLTPYLKVYYDSFDNDLMVFFDEFTKGNIQFTIIQGYSMLGQEQTDEVNKELIEDIKSAFGDDFSEDMLMFIDDDERRGRIRENDKRGVQRLNADFVSLTGISAEYLADDFGSRELYLKWKNGALEEKQFLFALINHIAEENRKLQKSNLEYFRKYELMNMTGNCTCPL